MEMFFHNENNVEGNLPSGFRWVASWDPCHKAWMVNIHPLDWSDWSTSPTSAWSELDPVREFLSRLTTR